MKEVCQRFFSKVKICGDGECWEWLGCKELKGHGRFRINNSKTEMAHRFSFELKNGPIPDGLCVCHTCDNPGCVNPRHLWIGTKGQNNKDRSNKGRNADTVGDKNPASKLSDLNVREIKKLLAEKVPQKYLAKKFNVSIAQICNINRGHSWNHI